MAIGEERVLETALHVVSVAYLVVIEMLNNGW